MSEFVKIGEVREFRKGRGRFVEVDGHRMAVFLTPDGFVALGDTCPHMGTSLSGGRVVDGAVECPWHHWRYDVRTGESGVRPWARVPVYEVRVAGGDVLVRRPPPPEPDPSPPADDDEDEDEDEEWMIGDPARFFRKRP